MTYFWRRQIDHFEVLGADQAQRLLESGVAKERIQLKRNFSPVAFSPAVTPGPIPRELTSEAGIILYSGNWGVPHDESTFVDAYSAYRKVIEARSYTLAERDGGESRSRRTTTSLASSARASIEASPA